MEDAGHRLAEVFEREKGRFLGFVRRQLEVVAQADAEDVVADVTFRLLQKGDLVDQVESLTAYIYRSLVNRIQDYRGRRRPTVPLEPDGEDPGPAIAHDGPDPEQAYGHSQLRERLGAALDQLSPRERAVWIATEVEGLSFRELADAWDEPIGTLLSRKSRATARLRESLKEFEPRHRSAR